VDKRYTLASPEDIPNNGTASAAIHCAHGHTAAANADHICDMPVCPVRTLHTWLEDDDIAYTRRPIDWKALCSCTNGPGLRMTKVQRKILAL
jgi:hypothetical protein